MLKMYIFKNKRKQKFLNNDVKRCLGV